MVEIEKHALIQILGINANKKKWRDRDVVAQYNHSCYIRNIRHSVPGCSGCIDSTCSLKTIALRYRGKTCKQRFSSMLIGKNLHPETRYKSSHSCGCDSLFFSPFV